MCLPGSDRRWCGGVGGVRGGDGGHTRRKRSPRGSYGRTVACFYAFLYLAQVRSLIRLVAVHHPPPHDPRPTVDSRTITSLKTDLIIFFVSMGLYSKALTPGVTLTPTLSRNPQVTPLRHPHPHPHSSTPELDAVSTVLLISRPWPSRSSSSPSIVTWSLAASALPTPSP